MSQIRLQKSPEMAAVLAFLKRKYHLLSEADIIKVALSEKYQRERGDSLKNEHIKRSWDELKREGKKLGDKLLAKKGLKREDLTEEDLYHLLEHV